MKHDHNSHGEVGRCTRCILPSNYPEISLNNEHVCNYCLSYQPQKPMGSDAFSRLIEEAKNHSGDYHCLVPLSGGRDSTYVLYQLKNIHGLNVLAFNYDNGFTSSVATDNVRRITDMMGVKLVQLKSKQDIQAKNLRHVVKLNLRKSPAHVISGFCSGCRNGIWGGGLSNRSKI